MCSFDLDSYRNPNHRRGRPNLNGRVEDQGDQCVVAAAEVEREVQDEVEEGLREVEVDSGIVVVGEVEGEAEDSVEGEVAAATRISRERGPAVEEGAHNEDHWR